MRQVESMREVIRRKPESRDDQRRREVRQLAAVIRYMREGHITRGEAEAMFEEHGLDAPKRRFRR